MKIKTSNTNDNSGLNFGLRFLRNDDSVMQASNIQGESFATYNSCFLKQEKFGTAEVVGKFIIYFASQSFASNAQTITTSKKDFGAEIYIFSNKFIVRKQNCEASIVIIISSQGKTFKIEDKNCDTNYVCPRFLVTSILSEFSASW